MPPMNSDQTAQDARYRAMVILWLGLFVSIMGFFFYAVLTPPDADRVENRFLTLAFTGVGLLAVIVSRIVKQRFLTRAVEKQEVALVQAGMITAAALCEMAALLGLMDRFFTNNRYYFVLMIIATFGALLNFPRREHLLAASYKKF
jgi:hypothetical protein